MPVECFEMNLLSLKRAKRIAPKEFVPAYEWFEQMQGKEVPRIWNNTRPAGIEISIMQQRGIAKPKGHLHAISVTSTKIRRRHLSPGRRDLGFSVLRTSSRRRRHKHQ